MTEPIEPVLMPGEPEWERAAKMRRGVKSQSVPPSFRAWACLALVLILAAIAVATLAGCADSPSPQPSVVISTRPDDPRLPMLHPPLADIMNYRTRPHSDGRPRVETESIPVIWLDDVASGDMILLDLSGGLTGMLFAGESIAVAWFDDDTPLLREYGVPKGKTAVLEYRAGDASVYVVGYLPGELKESDQ